MEVLHFLLIIRVFIRLPRKKRVHLGNSFLSLGEELRGLWPPSSNGGLVRRKCSVLVVATGLRSAPTPLMVVARPSDQIVVFCRLVHCLFR